MANGNPDPIRKRNAILLTGILMLVLAVIDEPSALRLFTSRAGRIALFLYLIGGSCFAQGITILGEDLLKSPIQPWYSRPGGILLLVCVTAAILMLWLLAGKAATQLLGMPPTDRNVYLYSIIGLTFIWVTLIRWVSYTR